MPTFEDFDETIERAPPGPFTFSLTKPDHTIVEDGDWRIELEPSTSGRLYLVCKFCRPGAVVNIWIHRNRSESLDVVMGETLRALLRAAVKEVKNKPTTRNVDFRRDHPVVIDILNNAAKA